MAKVKLEVEVSEKTHLIAKGLAQVVVDIKKSLDDGFDFNTDVGPIVGTVMANLLPVVAYIKDVEGEFTEDKVATVEAVVIGLKPLVDAIIKKA